MNKFMKKMLCDNKGSVLMEFLLVAPVYLALLGALFSINELVLLNNRVAVTDRNLSYDPYVASQYIRKSIWGNDNTGYTSRGNAAATFDVFSLTQGSSSRFGDYLRSYVTVKNQVMPSFIVGMRNAFTVIGGDHVELDVNDYPTTVGELKTYKDGTQQLGRHFVLLRRAISNTDRTPMYSIQNGSISDTNAHYSQAVNYSQNWQNVGSTDIVRTYVDSDSTSSSGSENPISSGVYTRVYHNFFTNIAQ